MAEVVVLTGRRVNFGNLGKARRLHLGKSVLNLVCSSPSRFDTRGHKIMKKWTLALLLLSFGWAAGQAQAGHKFLKQRAAYGASIPGTTAEYSSGYSGVAASSTPPIKPYSYYVAPAGMARGYYGYGEDNFPYNGRAYGHPYDPWTWPYLSYGYQNSLNRYYEAPVK